jgi:GNAT superfamily N-acetyltransferase
VSASELERIEAFDRELFARTSTSVVPFSHGTAYLNEDFPLRWDSNFLAVERSEPATSAPELAEWAERILGELGLMHREVFVLDGSLGDRLAPGFATLRWSSDHLVVMAQRRSPSRSVRGVGVEERSFEDARPVIEDVVRRAPYGTSEDVVRQLVDHRELLEGVANARFFVGRVDGVDAGVCESYLIDGVAQIEDVNTLEEHRGKGVATAVVTAAAEASRAKGAELVFLIADDGDWPKELYAKLGFDPLTRRWSFVRAGEDEPSAR